jgi:hypothetical protein
MCDVRLVSPAGLATRTADLLERSDRLGGQPLTLGADNSGPEPRGEAPSRASRHGNPEQHTLLTVAARKALRCFLPLSQRSSERATRCAEVGGLSVYCFAVADTWRRVQLNSVSLIGESGFGCQTGASEYLPSARAISRT